jgi:uncharacterized protein
MQKRDDKWLYSASDLVNFLQCEHLITLDLLDKVTPLPRTIDSDEARLIQAKGYAHEGDFLAELKCRHSRVIDISKCNDSLEEKVRATYSAMVEGYDIIFQATLQDDSFIGHADFLRKVDRPSSLGNWSYEVLDTKLSRSPQAKFIVQLTYYSGMIAKLQGVEPLLMHVILGDKTELAYRYAEHSRYLQTVIHRFLSRVQGQATKTYPVPCDKCGQCKWQGFCEERRLSDDHLSQVANISRVQIKKLEAAAVTTMAALAALPSESSIPKMATETLHKLRHQARLQHLARKTGIRQLEVLPLVQGELRGFERLPKPAEGDLFFDMEGNPLETGGLEYLFGLYYFEQGEPKFKTFWAHNRAQEKLAFEAFMDYVTAWLQGHPDAHIYHYAAYEQTAMKKLMSLHGTREAEVDNLLRTQKLVDLYKVVREGIRVSEPRYSIKNIEHFYLVSRTVDVKSAGASIVYYERWKETSDPQLLKDIEDYNFDDVRSTFELRQWLLGIRPMNARWLASQQTGSETTPKVGEMTPEEMRLVAYRERLVEPLPQDRTVWGKVDQLKELTYQLLDFHRRAAKPEWWAIFSRMEFTDDELVDDGECLGGLTLDPDNPPLKINRSVRYTLLFPEQGTKLRTGVSSTITQTGESINNLTVDDEHRRISFTRGAGKAPLPEKFGLGPGLPLSSKALIEGVFRFCDSVLAGNHRYTALESFLTQAIPVIKGQERGAPIIQRIENALPYIIEAIASLDCSYLFVQGPPGAGKTYTGSHVIVALMKRGFKVGISSNSHKAINNLLLGIEQVAVQDGFSFCGVKKSSAQNTDSSFEGQFVSDVADNKDVWRNLGSENGYQLVAGTAWLFADPQMDQKLDYLFVDEAGQVALANLVAMGTSARNIVLLGDQMQLGQPVKGVHPGRSGESILEYLLNGLATIPPERGIFLSTTWRMHPDVCSFISDAVYDGRLVAEPANARQSLLLKAAAHPALKPTGISYFPVSHDSCSQRSEEEAAVVLAMFNSLLQQQYRDKHGRVDAIKLDDILVVAPYNMQVNLLRKVLPEGARVGTVDKFQGQEAEIVIISMATSSGEYLPRDIGFLYSKNRLNVAISRAKCLAIFISNPDLMSIRCTTPEEMALVNTLCWVRDVGSARGSKDLY